MDRKSCRNMRRKKKLLTNHNMGHMTRKENYTVTSHCRRGGFCPCAWNRFTTFTDSMSKSQPCSDSKEKTRFHAQKTLNHSLLSRHDNCNVVNILFIYSIEKQMLLIQKETENEMEVSQCQWNLLQVIWRRYNNCYYYMLKSQRTFIIHILLVCVNHVFLSVQPNWLTVNRLTSLSCICAVSKKYGQTINA